MSIHIVKVDASGKDAQGEDYHFHAAPEMVARGYMVNVPTLIQYPNGNIRTGNQVKLTPAGIAFLKREMPVGLRDAEGSA